MAFSQGALRSSTWMNYLLQPSNPVRGRNGHPRRTGEETEARRGASRSLHLLPGARRPLWVRARRFSPGDLRLEGTFCESQSPSVCVQWGHNKHPQRRGPAPRPSAKGQRRGPALSSEPWSKHGHPSSAHWGPIPERPFTCRVTLGSRLNLSEPGFPPLKMRPGTTVSTAWAAGRIR